MTIAYELYPGTLYLNITNRCSNACTFCVRQGADFSLGGFPMRLHHEPTAEEVLAAIATAAAGSISRFDEIVFCGFGEPTYRLDVIHAVGQELRRQGATVRLNTNGHAALINEGDPFEKLVSAVDEISISLNAPNAASYESLCRPVFGTAAFPAVLAFARQSVALIPTTTLTVVRFNLSAAAIQQCRQIAAEIGADFRVR